MVNKNIITTTKKNTATRVSVIFIVVTAVAVMIFSILGLISQALNN